MILPWPTSLPWLLAAWLSVSIADQVIPEGVRQIPLRSHSLQSVSQYSRPSKPADELQEQYGCTEANGEFGEDTIVRADQYIRLTSDRQAQHGWLFSRMPMSATNWMIEVEFKIHGQGHLHGDGMAIWLTEERGKPGKVFGHTDNFNGLGIFIDTYKNQRPGVVFPYVMAMLGNSSVSYDKDHDGKDNELAGCSARGLRTGGTIPTKIRMTYYQETSLKVEIQHKGPDEWTDCFETDAIKLPQTAYLGFSAETGELTDHHDIISVNSYNLHVRQNQAGVRKDPGKKMKPYNPGGEKEKGSWRWFFLKIVLFGVVCVGGYVGYTMYRASRRGSRF